MKRTCMPMLVLVLATGGAGCVKEDAGGPTDGEARAAGDALGNGLEDSAATYGPMTTSSADTTCVTLGGDSSDPDGDSIPVNATLTYDCVSMAIGYTGTLTGTLSAADDQPAALAWAFTGTADMHAMLTAPGGGSITSDWDGSLVGTQASAIGPYVLERTLDVVTVFQSGGDLRPVTTMVVEDNDWTITFTPQATWTPGGLVVTGSLNATGAWNVTVGGKTLTATLTTPTPLTVTPSCETLLTAGVAVGTYPVEGGGTGTITVTWTGCGTRTVVHAE